MAAPSVGQFRFFTSLPPEIRFMIWNEALNEEAKTRVVFVDGDSFRVLPRKDLVSPFLSVNRESRMFAKALYDTRIDVYRTPAHPMQRLDAAKVEGSRWNDINLAKEIEQLGRLEGSIYLNPACDVFVMDSGKFWVYFVRETSETVSDFPFRWDWTATFCSSILPDETLSRLQRVAYEEPRMQATYTEKEVKTLWCSDSDLITGICQHLYLRIPHGEIIEHEIDLRDERKFRGTFEELQWVDTHEGRMLMYKKSTTP